jgi:hypothetical protein
LKITIIWHNELFNGKGLKAKHMIFVGLFHSNAGKNVIDNFSSLPVVIQHYVIKFASDLWQVHGFLCALRFPPPIKLNPTEIC